MAPWLPDFSHPDFGDADCAVHGATGSRSRSHLVGNHVAGLDKAVGKEEDVVLSAAGPVNGKLLPVKLVADDEVAAAAALEIALLEAGFVCDDFGLALLSGGEEQSVVVAVAVLTAVARG